MEIQVKETDNNVTITVSGDIEMMSIKKFKEKLTNVGQSVDKDVVLDLTNVSYIDSSGVGVLIHLLKLQKKKGKQLQINQVSSQVLTVLQLSSLSHVFNL